MQKFDCNAITILKNCTIAIFKQKNIHTMYILMLFHFSMEIECKLIDTLAFYNNVPQKLFSINVKSQ